MQFLLLNVLNHPVEKSKTLGIIKNCLLPADYNEKKSKNTQKMVATLRNE